jgi:hypothetical protein
MELKVLEVKCEDLREGITIKAGNLLIVGTKKETQPTAMS